MNDFRQEFLAFCLAREVLRFGEFVTKAGRRTPYFFNAGQFNDGESLRRLGRFYAEALRASGLACDGLFGPAYKGIPLAAATAIALAEMGQNLPYSFNRKEAKDHGEGGSLIGAPLKGRIVIVDDVITAGTSVRESVDDDPRARRGAGRRADRAGPDGARTGRAVGGARGAATPSAFRSIAIATLDDVMAFIAGRPELARYADAIAAYRAQYGAN